MDVDIPETPLLPVGPEAAMITPGLGPPFGFGFWFDDAVDGDVLLPEMRRIAPLLDDLLDPTRGIFEDGAPEDPRSSDDAEDDVLSKGLGGMAGCWKVFVVLLLMLVLFEADTLEAVVEVVFEVEVGWLDDVVVGEAKEVGDSVEVSLLGTLVGAPPPPPPVPASGLMLPLLLAPPASEVESEFEEGLVTLPPPPPPPLSAPPPLSFPDPPELIPPAKKLASQLAN